VRTEARVAEVARAAGEEHVLYKWWAGPRVSAGGGGELHSLRLCQAGGRHDHVRRRVRVTRGEARAALHVA